MIADAELRARFLAVAEQSLRHQPSALARLRREVRDELGWTRLSVRVPLLVRTGDLDAMGMHHRVEALLREIVAHWLQRNAPEPVAPLAAPAAAAAAPRKGGRPSKDAERTALLKTILEKLEGFARAERLDFDRQNMPGPLGESWEEKGSFHWFCAQIEREFRVQKRTFARIRAGLCAVKRFAPRGDFYTLALRHIAPKMQPAEKQRGAQKA